VLFVSEKIGKEKEMNAFFEKELIEQPTSRIASLAFVFLLTPGKTEEWRDWGEEILGLRRSEYQALRHRLGLTAQRIYLQQTLQGDVAIIYLEGGDLQRAFQELRTSKDPFVVWFRQRAKDLLNGLDLTQISPGSLSKLVFDGQSIEEDERSFHTRQAMERLGLISP
jgi:hypothetical protein